jgi:hypothetical protein
MEIILFEFEIRPKVHALCSCYIYLAIDLYRKEALRSLWRDSTDQKTSRSRNFDNSSCEYFHCLQLHV